MFDLLLDDKTFLLGCPQRLIDIAEKAVEVIDKKGVKVVASGMLAVRLYEGKRGKQVAIELKGVRELKIYDRDGDLVKVLSGEEVE